MSFVKKRWKSMLLMQTGHCQNKLFGSVKFCVLPVTQVEEPLVYCSVRYVLKPLKRSQHLASINPNGAFMELDRKNKRYLTAPDSLLMISDCHSTLISLRPMSKLSVVGPI